MPTENLETNSTSKAGRASHLAFLDGMRGLAALYIVLHHLWGGTEFQPGMLGRFFNWLAYGHLAVGFFIVLSGFCLALPTTKPGFTPPNYWTFMKRRAIRILPPYYASILLVILISVALEYKAHHTFGLPFSPAVLLVHGFLLQDVFPGLLRINEVLWSVALEFKIYMLFPVILWLRKTYGNVPTLVISLVVGYLLQLFYFGVMHTINNMFTCPWFLLLFVMGVCAAHIASGTDISTWRLYRTRTLACLTVLSLSLLLVLSRCPISNDTVQYPFNYVRLLPLFDPVMGVICAIGLVFLYLDVKAEKQTLPLRFTSWPPLVKVGSFSYSLYLVHMPLITLLWHFFHFPVRVIVLFCLSIVASYVFFLCCERPFLSRVSSSKSPKRPAKAIVSQHGVL